MKRFHAQRRAKDEDEDEDEDKDGDDGDELALVATFAS